MSVLRSRVVETRLGRCRPSFLIVRWLGISERTDALVIVVSKERGTIGLAENGRLEQVPESGQPRARLESHDERVGFLSATPTARRWLPGQPRLKAVASGSASGGGCSH